METFKFLRSINIALDLDDPTRLSHFRPTSKSANLIERVMGANGDRALLVVAPYGSGKSLTAGYLLHAVQNEPARFPGGSELLTSISARIEDLDPNLAEILETRGRSGWKGVGASLHGHYPNTVEALQQALSEGLGRARISDKVSLIDVHKENGVEAVGGLIDDCVAILNKHDRDHLLIVWDEFGRHLEALVSEGRPGELLAIQVLAEAANRVKGKRVTLLLLLHRSFLGYAAGLPTGIRQEWSKIEGRFEVLQFVDDSLEMHRLLCGVVRELRPDAVRAPAPSALESDANSLIEAGLFPGVPQTVLAGMLSDAWPLDPATLWLLPRISARVAQNERTAFSFLHSVDLRAPVTPAVLYDYFRGEFQADSGPGGTHRPWLELESAIAKVDDDTVEADILKVSFLLGLGLSGEKSRTTRKQLEIIASRGHRDPVVIGTAIDRLVKRNLIIHRRQSDQVLVWHGTDVDLRGRVEDEKHRIQSSFELVSFLTRESPPPVWRPTGYNAEFGVPRYFSSQYLTAEGFAIHLDQLKMGLREPGVDGEVLYVLSKNDEERRVVLRAASRNRDPRIFIAIPRSTDSLGSIALELSALLLMHQDQDLLSQDPMVRSELDLFTDDVRQALVPALDRVHFPGKDAADWYHCGSRMMVEDDVSLRIAFSRVMGDVFPRTPNILSEMVVRRRPTAVVINARKKVILGILERYGQESLGIEGDFADKAIFRAVFLRTGLYRKDGERWRFAKPSEISDAGLSAVWARIGEFFTTPGTKSAQTLLFELVEPPYGVREGLLPLLFAAGLKAFPSPKALRTKATFLTDVLPSHIEEICKHPEDFVLDVVALSQSEEEYLQEILETFAASVPLDEGIGDDLIRRAFDAVMGWWTLLPEAAKSSPGLSKVARKFRMIISRPDPVAVLLHDLPSEFGGNQRNLEKTFAAIRASVAELEGLYDRFVESARRALAQALSARGIVDSSGVRASGNTWASYFPKDLALPSLSPIARSTLLQLRRVHANDEALLNALALLLTGHAFKDWNDTVIPEFERRLRAVLEDIEHAALQNAIEKGGRSGSEDGIVGLARARLRLSLTHLASLVGDNLALDLVDEEINGLWQTLTKDRK